MTTAQQHPIQRALHRFLESLPAKSFTTLACEDSVVRTLGGPQRYDEAGGYPLFSGFLNQAIHNGNVAPIKSRGTNGKHPPLHRWYRICIENAAEQLGSVRPLLESLHPRMATAWYQNHAVDALRDEPILRPISDYLFSLDRLDLPCRLTLNERSYAIFGDEKLLASPTGQAVLRRINLTESALHCRRTYEPFFYVHLAPNGSYALVCENRDTFFSLQHVLISQPLQPTLPLCLLIYGEGKKIEKSLQFIDEVTKNTLRILYFGDIDAEGLAILARLTASVEFSHSVLPHEPLYAALLTQCRAGIPTTTKQRLTSAERHQLAQVFRDTHLLNSMLCLVDQGRRVPQEALNQETLLPAQITDLS